MKNRLLEINNLRTYFFTHEGVVKAVDDISLAVDSGEMVGIVGESGCGKSVLARSILRLIPDPPGRIVDGEINFGDNSLLDLSEKEMQQIRGNEISMIFQEPMTSLNPVYTVGVQVAEVFRKHQKISKREAIERSIEMLGMVGIPSPESRVKEYPFQMSGGMRQRIVIAMALACHPKLILADEPTTALDVTIQAQILSLINKLEHEFGTSMILITHDLGVIAEVVARVIVMYAGKLVEQALVDDLFNRPLHPYTQGLMWSVPSLEEDQNKDTEPLKEIPGIVPDLGHLPQGCYFSPRCHKKMEICRHEEPTLVENLPGHWVKCWLYDETKGKT
jgi:peptide/nickel transport system ATP-binding protein/oligopeptide transport system ATP-binding protein